MEFHDNDSQADPAVNATADTPLDMTVIILTLNETVHIARCIESLKGLVKRICVVDSHSTDDTRDIARSLGADVYENTWENYATQFQWGLDNCAIDTAWTMRMDADEYVEPALRDELRSIIPGFPATVNGIYLRCRIIFLGRAIRHGFVYPLRVLRIWRTGQGRIEQRWMDEHIVLENPNTFDSRHDFVNENLKDMTWFIDKQNNYATREMFDVANIIHGISETDEEIQKQSGSGPQRKRFIKEKIYVRIPGAFRATLYFLYRYIFGLGFLDGKEGFYFHFMQGYWYRNLVELKLLEIEKEAKAKGIENIRDAIEQHYDVKL